MKRMLLSVILLVGAISTGCDKNDTATSPAEGQITFTTTIAATRAPQLEEDGSGTLTA